MSGTVYCFASAKGGSGKTILAATLSTLLTHLGKRCLLIDADATTNGMTLFFLDQLVAARKSWTGNAELVGLFDTSEAVTLPFALSEKLSLLPATYVLHDTQRTTTESFCASLNTTLATAQQEFDFVLIDAQAGADVFALESMRRADQVVIVSEYDPISAKGIERLKGLMSDKVPLENTWVLFNKVLPEFTKSLGDFLGVSRYLPPVPWSAEVVRAYVRGRLALDMEKGNLFTLGMLETASVLFGPEIADLADRWKQSKDEVIRAPIRDQLEMVKAELAATEKAKFLTDYEATRQSQATRRLIVTGMTMILGVLSTWQLASIYGEFSIPSDFSYIFRRLFPVVVMMFGVAAVGFYYRRQKIEEDERRELVGQSAELSHRLRDLETKLQQLEAYTNSSLAEVLRGQSDRL